MITYKEFQFGTIVFVLGLPAHLFLVYTYFSKGGNDMTEPGFIIMNLVMMVIYALFYGMRTRIENHRLVVSFGVGLIWKSVDLSKVKEATNVTSPWYFGWGIRYIPGGMMYNISGRHAVELSFEHTKRILRIGTKSPQKLNEAVLSAIKTKA